MPLGFYKKGVLENFAKFTGNYLCRSFLFNKAYHWRPVIFLKKETPTQLFSCEFYEIFKNTFLEHLLVTASKYKC